MEEDKLKKDITVRLRRIDGQVKGIEKMIQSDTCCKEVLVQIAAVRAAINKVGAMLIERYATHCMMGAEGEDLEDGIKQLVNTINTFMK
ncbi:metal-sensitive transcriptional regulator [Clostridium oryzae]|uniref:Copper-sensing transcriptional repressor CsoR n=1 Tax=Clostridium oryzae TaxID=1450648 RepID=A0A1V4IU69_9CLOT|nr:metal-sensitive transcriptional regulator [Clostridium oryzae]OPJ63591.1 copper-sensing transcriptional repressor CsoR [Clostridium oryzae]